MEAGPQAALAELRERFVERLIAGDAQAAQQVVADALDVAPVAAVYREVLTEALYEVGRRWQRGDVGVAEEHLATGICEVVLPDLAARLPRLPRRRRTAVAACVPGELHAVGSRIVGDVLDAAGWDVLHLGAFMPTGGLVEIVVARNVDVVALSAAGERRLPELEEAAARLRALPRPPLVALGGLAVSGQPEGERADVAVVSHSPEALVELLAERFPLD
jgi:MerR family transcriptional regulator, light-induced transcriptional regulator